MTITYSVDPNLHVVFVSWSGCVTKRELADHLNTLFVDEKASAFRRSVTDTRAATNVEFEYSDISKILSSIVKPHLGDESWKAAVIVPKPYMFGVGRQFQALSDGHIEMALFADETSALEWISH